MNINFSDYEGINDRVGILYGTKKFVPVPTDTADVNMQNRERFAALIY